MRYEYYYNEVRVYKKVKGNPLLKWKFSVYERLCRKCTKKNFHLKKNKVEIQEGGDENFHFVK